MFVLSLHQKREKDNIICYPRNRLLLRGVTGHP